MIKDDSRFVIENARSSKYKIIAHDMHIPGEQKANVTVDALGYGQGRLRPCDTRMRRRPEN